MGKEKKVASSLLRHRQWCAVLYGLLKWAMNCTKGGKEEEGLVVVRVLFSRSVVYYYLK